MYMVHMISGEPRRIQEAEAHEVYEGFVYFLDNYHKDCGIYIPITQIKFMEKGK